MDIQALSAFRAVAETGSFTRAAARLFITQPATSKRVAALEAELGVKLFDRIGQRPELTHAGRLLLPRAIRILDEVAESRRQIVNLSGKICGRLVFATSHHIGLHRLPPVLQRFTRRYPEVQLDLRFMASERACREVEAGHLELAVVTLPESTGANLHAEKLWDDKLEFVVSHDSQASNLNMLAQRDAILPSRETVTRQLIARRFRESGFELTVAMETNYLETIKKMVEIGLGWSALPATMVDDSLRVVPIENPIHRQLGIVTCPRRTLSNAGAAMNALLRVMARRHR